MTPKNITGVASNALLSSEFGNPTNLRRAIDALAMRIERAQENLHRAISIARPLLTVDPRDLPMPKGELAEMADSCASPYVYELRGLAEKLEGFNVLLYELGSHFDT